MKIIQVMIAAAEELHNEKLRFTELIANLNEVLEPRGIRLKRVKWTPGEADDYYQRLSQCEMCLKLYWNQLPDASEKELQIAYQATCAGENPHHLYIYFKEPSIDISKDLADFKATFETRYGHFFCRFENVDTMNLHFLLQFEALQNIKEENLVSVANGHVSVGNQQFVDLDNVPFAGLNKEYRRLQNEVSKLECQQIEVRAQYKNDPGNNELLETLISLTNALKETLEEYNHYQEYLVSKEREFVCASNEKITDRMRKARELFERGEAAEAARLMNVDELLKAKENSDKLWDLELEHRKLQIEELKDAASYAMTNPEQALDERFETACKAYEGAIDIARHIHYDNDKMVILLENYASLLSDFNQLNEAEQYFYEALELYVNIAGTDLDFEHNVAMKLKYIGDLQAQMHRFEDAEDSYNYALSILHIPLTESDTFALVLGFKIKKALALLQSDLKNYEEAEKFFKDILELYRLLSETIPNETLPFIADTLVNLANMQGLLHQFDEAENNCKEALTIYNDLAKANPDAFLPNLASTMNSYAALHYYLKHYDEAETYYKEALAIYRQLADVTPAFLEEVATTSGNLATILANLNRYDDAERIFIEANDILHRLSMITPEAFLPVLVTVLNDYAGLQKDMHKYDEAKAHYDEALLICRFFAKSDSNAFLPDLAMTLNNIAVLQIDLKLFDEAEVSCKESLEIYRCLAETHRDAFLPYLALSYSNLGFIQNNLKNYKEAELNLNEALKIYYNLVTIAPDAFYQGLANSLNNLALLQMNQQRYSESENNYLKSLSIRRQLADVNEDAYLPDLVETIENYAYLLFALNQEEKAKSFIKEALDIYIQLNKKNHYLYADKINTLKDMLQ